MYTYLLVTVCFLGALHSAPVDKEQFKFLSECPQLNNTILVKPSADFVSGCATNTPNNVHCILYKEILKQTCSVFSKRMLVNFSNSSIESAMKGFTDKDYACKILKQSLKSNDLRVKDIKAQIIDDLFKCIFICTGTDFEILPICTYEAYMLTLINQTVDNPNSENGIVPLAGLGNIPQETEDKGNKGTSTNTSSGPLQLQPRIKETINKTVIKTNSDVVIPHLPVIPPHLSLGSPTDKTSVTPVVHKTNTTSDVDKKKTADINTSSNDPNGVKLNHTNENLGMKAILAVQNASNTRPLLKKEDVNVNTVQKEGNVQKEEVQGSGVHIQNVGQTIKQNSPNTQIGGLNDKKDAPYDEKKENNLNTGQVSLNAGQSVQNLGQNTQIIGQSVQNGGENVQHGEEGIQNSRPSIQNGGSTIQNGGSSIQSGRQSIQNGGPSIQNGGQSIQNGEQSIQNGGPNIQNGGQSIQNGEQSIQNGGSSIQNGEQRYPNKDPTIGGKTSGQSALNTAINGPNNQNHPETAVQDEPGEKSPGQKVINNQDEFPEDAGDNDSFDDEEMDFEETPQKSTNGEKFTTVNKKPLEPDSSDINIAPVNYSSEDIDDGDSYFFSYFMVVCLAFIGGYVIYHNKQRILALIVEGRRGRRNSRSRRPNSANYKKLDTNLEEAISSSCNKNATNVIY